MKTSKYKLGRFAARLRSLRTAAGLTQAQVANQLRIDRSLYESKEAGRSDPSYDQLFKLRDLYGFDNINQLLGPDFANGVCQDEGGKKIRFNG